MVLSFSQAFVYDESGYFDHEIQVQVDDGLPLMPSRATTVCPWGDGVKDDSKFYRFEGGRWTTEAKPTKAEDLLGVVVSHTSMSPRDIEMRELVKKFAQEEGYREKRGEDLSWSIERIPEKTAEEKRIEAEQMARSKRDALLSESDYYLQPDYPSNEEGLNAVKVYRTALRDVPQQEGFPLSIEWPVKPDVLN